VGVSTQARSDLRGRLRLRRWLAGVVFALSTLALVGLVGVILLEDWASDDPIAACPDPAGQLYNPGQPRWSTWPPGMYCDFRAIHPDWPERQAVENRPSAVRGAALISLPPVIVSSLAILWRSRNKREGA
jgi:hypothetical protein